MRNFTPLTYFVFLFAIVFFCVSWVDENAKLEKKLDKQIAKVWNNKLLQKQELQNTGKNALSDERQFYKIVSDSNATKGFAILNKSYGCRVGGCAVYSSDIDKSGNYDPFYYCIITDKNFVIQRVKILEFHSDYGYQITNTKWLAQFIGLQSDEVEYENKIDAISGATISVRSLIDDVKIACEVLQEMEKADSK